jgi:hypothetical protein
MGGLVCGEEKPRGIEAAGKQTDQCRGARISSGIEVRVGFIAGLLAMADEQNLPGSGGGTDQDRPH